MDRGFSLVEALVAIAVMTTGVVALVPLSAFAVRVNLSARGVTMATVLASDKAEQLKSLAWGVDAFGRQVVDTSTDTAFVPERSSGGTGLSRSPQEALSQDTPGYCDFLDANGRSLGGGAQPPDGTIYVRRWAISPSVTNPTDTLVLQVLVTRRHTRESAVRLVSLRTPGAM